MADEPVAAPLPAAESGSASPAPAPTSTPEPSGEQFSGLGTDFDDGDVTVDLSPLGEAAPLVEAKATEPAPVEPPKAAPAAPPVPAPAPPPVAQPAPEGPKETAPAASSPPSEPQSLV